MLLVAAVLVAVIGVAHSILGEVYILRPLYRQTELPKLRGAEFPLGTIRFAWHVTSLLLFGIAVVLVQIATRMSLDAVIITIGWTLLASSALPLIYSRGKHPSWILLISAGAVCLLSASGWFA